jgi:hypothetical protein
LGSTRLERSIFTIARGGYLVYEGRKKTVTSLVETRTKRRNLSEKGEGEWGQ